MGLFDKATGGTGLFGNESQWLQDERDKISTRHTRDWQDRQNPFRMLGGALKAHNLKNSPETQQMRDTQTLLEQIDINRPDEVDFAIKKLTEMGNIKGAYQLREMYPRKEVKAPLIKDFIEGDEKVTKQYDHNTAEWVELSRGNRWQEKGGSARWKPKSIYRDGKAIPAENDEQTGIWRFSDAGQNKAFTTSQLGEAGYLLTPAKDNKAPTTRRIREDMDIVYQEWDKTNSTWVEVGRGDARSAGAGNTSLINLFDKYEKQYKADGIGAKLDQLNNIKVAARNPGGLSRKALQTSLADLFGGQTRAVAELERFRSNGTLPRRLTDSAKDFFMGDITEESRKAALQFAYIYERDVLRPKFEKLNTRFKKLADDSKVSADLVLRELPEFYNFEAMDGRELLNLGNTPGFIQGLDIFQQEAYRSRIKTLRGAQ